MITKYTAPGEVYQIARTMVLMVITTKKHNITWGLPVDSGFTYMTAEVVFDLIIWTQQSNVPIYKDYVLLMSKEENKQDITIALQQKYYNVILNGIEVFKVNGSDNNLAGPNPELLLAPPPLELFNPTSGKSKTKRRVLVVEIAESSLKNCSRSYAINRIKKIKHTHKNTRIYVIQSFDDLRPRAQQQKKIH
ncbi:hypothetical protein QQP08_013128 [Theobroma cacao]|nr:hypothetical protein QQP08_013128 [Theobroma cacao]